jgi:hypothetical protein
MKVFLSWFTYYIQGKIDLVVDWIGRRIRRVH